MTFKRMFVLCWCAGEANLFTVILLQLNHVLHKILSWGMVIKHTIFIEYVGRNTTFVPNRFVILCEILIPFTTPCIIFFSIENTIFDKSPPAIKFQLS
jgi:hypothetical protein